MSAGILLIDGYNLMHAAGFALPDYKPGELLKCRTRLLRLLLDKLTAAEIRGTTIVFDARDPPPDRPAQVVVSGLKVLFANPGGDADVVIQQWLAHHSSPRRVTLVSSDRVLQRAARGCHAKFVGSDEFLNDLERRRKHHHQNATRAGSPGAAHASHADDSKPAAHLSASQTAYWLKIFGDSPPVVPDDPVVPDNAEKSAGAPTSKTAKSKPPAARAGHAASESRASRSRTAGSARHAAQDDAEYWLRVFSDLSTSSADSSPEELRLADLENWLKDFQTKNL